MARRVKGRWITLNIEKTSDVETTVANTFAKNAYSHSVKFRAKNGLFHLYEPLQLRLENKLFMSYVATIEMQKDSEYSLITCGELQTEYPFLKLV